MTKQYGFELMRDEQIPELNTRARLLRHAATGAEVLSLENDDENKVFGVALRTPPPDSSGIAHILEHTVLCGSRKYPLKDPFVQLIKGSLQTFLNAMTYPDKTVYPVASQNLKDFYNLIDVYLDAVFHPRLDPHHFEQEGWHYELEQLGQPLIYKGVVFNEMKGANASPDRVSYKEAQRSLLPDTPYGFDSGGDPAVIPNLTYEQFVGFHRAYYHPSNARIVFYGDDDPTERLRLLSEYLDGFDRAEPQSALPLQAPFDAPRSQTHGYPAGTDGSAKPMLTVNWLLHGDLDQETRLGLDILEYILIGTPAAPLRRALIESGLGEDLAGVGLQTDLRQAYFSAGLKGIAADSAGQVEALILDTLGGLARDGIDPDTVDAAINTVEFMLREQNTGSFPRGISLMLRALSTWLHDGDPFEPLAFEAPLEAVKAHIASGRYFEGLIERFLLNNQHRTTLLLTPDSEQTAREAAAEQSRLEQVRAALGPGELEAIVENTRLLKQLQATPDTPEVIATLPSLARSDLDRTIKTVPTEESDVQGTRLLYHDLFTNGIAYLDLGFDLRGLPPELLPYLPLFSRGLLELGTAHEDYVRLSQRIGRSTGGIRQQLFISATRDGGTAARLILRGKAMVGQASELLAIIRDVLLDVRLDNRERFRQMALEEKASMESGAVSRGLQFANMRLRARNHEADWASEQIGGVSYLWFVRRLVQEIEEDWPGVLARLEQLRSTLVNRQGAVCNVTLDSAAWREVGPRLEAFLGELPAAPQTVAAWATSTETGSEGFSVPSKVNYVGKGGNLLRHGYAIGGSAMVIARYLRTTWLWEKIRVQGGAYGGMSSLDRYSGMFTLLSYRDPNLLDTLAVYDQTADFLRRVELDEVELTRAIIGTISDMDPYQLPDAKGYSALLRVLLGETDATRQRFRDEVLGTEPEHFRAFADVLDQLMQTAPAVVVGGKEALEAANTERPGLLEITQLL
ncbi:MAG TPA: insulinase family protein [Roseiflexaceae bacterium]|nr:insulinase family protein [Roseiflexaceae bacterium]